MSSWAISARSQPIPNGPDKRTRFDLVWPDGVTRQVQQTPVCGHTHLAPAFIITSFWWGPNVVPDERYRIYRERLVSWTPPPTDITGPTVDVVSLGYGWPAISMATDWATRQGPVRPVNALTVDALPEISLGYEGYVPAAVPGRPIWTGLLINALAAWPVCFLLTFVTRFPRRLRDIVRCWKWGWKKGLCPSCGYSVDGLDTCPECGENRPDRYKRP